MHDEIKELGLKCLKKSGNYTPYNVTDMGNATLIFQEVFAALMYDNLKKKKVPVKIASNIATKAGKDMRKYIKKYTGLDTHDSFK